MESCLTNILNSLSRWHAFPRVSDHSFSYLQPILMNTALELHDNSFFSSFSSGVKSALLFALTNYFFQQYLQYKRGFQVNLPKLHHHEHGSKALPSSIIKCDSIVYSDAIHVENSKKIRNAEKSWDIPDIPRENKIIPEHLSLNPTLVSLMNQYQVDVLRGFIPKNDPLPRLTHPKYRIWEELADDLPKILGARHSHIRDIINNLPILSISDLETEEELYRAHFLLSLFAQSFVWGVVPPKDYLPECIALPLWEISKILDYPPILTYVDIALLNWRKLDKDGDVHLTNIVTLNNILGGQDESWFYLVSVDIEKRGACTIYPLLALNLALKEYLSTDPTISNFSSNELTVLLQDGVETLKLTAEALHVCDQIMFATREGCDPHVFFHRVRPFLSGWKHNPTLPNGLRYLGVTETWNERNVANPDADYSEYVRVDVDSYPYQQFSGSSAAQSALPPFFDIMLGVNHSQHDASPSSHGFLKAMRQYMMKPHREFLEYIESEQCIREFVVRLKSSEASQTNLGKEFIGVYDRCLEELSNFRVTHMKLVKDYIIAVQARGLNKDSVANAAGGKGTGGTDLISFLKPIQTNCLDAKL